MGLFGNSRKVSKEIIQGELVESSSNGNENEVLEWSPSVVYRYGELTTYSTFYANSVDGPFVEKAEKRFNEIFFRDYKDIKETRIRYVEGTSVNVVIEFLHHDIVLSNFKNKNGNFIGSASSGETFLQAILICGTCLTIPLFPNEIIGFRTEDKSLKFICDQCSHDTGKKHYPIDQIQENENLTTLKDVKLVKNMKEFKPTTLLTDHDDKTRPQIVNVEKIDRDSIKVGEENDLRTVSKVAESIERDPDHIKLALPLLLENRTYPFLLHSKPKEHDGEEFDKVLKQLNDFNYEPIVSEVFAEVGKLQKNESNTS